MSSSSDVGSDTWAPRALVVLLWLGFMSVGTAFYSGVELGFDAFAVPKLCALVLCAVTCAVVMLGSRDVCRLVGDWKLTALVGWTLLAGVVVAHNRWFSIRAGGVLVGGCVIFMAARAVSLRSFPSRVLPSVA